MESEQRQFRTDDGLTLVADTYGDPEAPPVLLLHGGGQTRHAWGGTARALAEAGWYGVALDQRGHGDSDWCPEGDYRLDRYSRDALQVARALATPPVAVGASLGGLASLLASGAEGPPALAAVVLVDITPRMNYEGAANILGFMGERLEEGFATLEEAADAIAAYLPHRPRPKDLSGLRKNLRLHDDGRYRWHWDPKFVVGERPPGIDMSQERMLDAARNLDVPAMLVRGRMSELVDEQAAREFRELVPHAHYVDVSGAAHMVAGDRNDAFTQAVTGFLATLQSPGA